MRIIVPDLYPQEPPLIYFEETTLPPSVIEQMDYKSRMIIWELLHSHSFAPTTSKSYVREERGITAKNILELRRIEDFLASLTSLSELDDSKSKRRMIKRTVKAEKQREAEDKAENPSEQRKAPSEAKCTLFVAMQSIVADCVTIKAQHCITCAQLIVQPSRAQLTKIEYERGAVHVLDKTAQRLECGHWLHHACFLEYISAPPFGEDKQCDKCGQVVRHPMLTKEFVAKKKVNWANKQRFERELDEVAEFMKDAL